MNLTEKTCKACSGETPRLSDDEIAPLHKEVSSWQIVDRHHLLRAFRFADFLTALEFVNKVGVVAEQEGHHPDIVLKWGAVDVTIYTHKVDGLTEADFILAAKIDQMT